MDRSRYPANWEEISLRIRERDSQACMQCGVKNGAIGYRLMDGSFVQVFDSIDNVDQSADAMTLDGIKLIRIVLTVAHHPDPDPSNCAESNLRSLCQRCHNRLDRPYRGHNAAVTRRSRKVQAGQMELI
jgi:5-methylcytosine-specific restriction endonuclease McrA